MVLRIKAGSEICGDSRSERSFAIVPSAFVTQGLAQGTTTLDTIEVVTPRIVPSDEPQKGFQGTPDWVYVTPGPSA